MGTKDMKSICSTHSDIPQDVRRQNPGFRWIFVGGTPERASRNPKRTAEPSLGTAGLAHLFVYGLSER